MTPLRRLAREDAPPAAAAPAPPQAALPAIGVRRTITLDTIFSPYAVGIGLYVPLVALYLAIPGDVYEDVFEATKHATPKATAFYGLAIVLFLVGAVAGDLMARRAGAREPDTLAAAVRGRVRMICVGALLAGIAAYLTWIALAVWRAGGPASLLERLGADPQYVRFTLFATVPGVTTLTQAALAGVVLAIAFRFVGNRLVRLLLVAALALALSITVLGSQRIVTLEIVVAATYLLLAGRRASLPRVAGLIALAVGGVVVFFVLAEILRKGAYESFTVFEALQNFSSYYLNSINNAFAIVEHYAFSIPLFYSTAVVWEFPGVSMLGLHYEDVFGVSGTTLEDNLHRELQLSRGSTTFGVPGETSAELGWAALLLILGIGAAAGALYRAGRRDVFYRALYAVWLVGLVEFTRIYYFLEPRLLPTYVILAAVFVVLVRGRARAPAEGAAA